MMHLPVRDKLCGIPINAAECMLTTCIPFHFFSAVPVICLTVCLLLPQCISLIIPTHTPWNLINNENLFSNLVSSILIQQFSIFYMSSDYIVSFPSLVLS